MFRPRWNLTKTVAVCVKYKKTLSSPDRLSDSFHQDNKHPSNKRVPQALNWHKIMVVWEDVELRYRWIGTSSTA